MIPRKRSQKTTTYSSLPRVIIISIVDFHLFDCAEYHSEFRPLEVKRHEQLSDRMVMHYFYGSLLRAFTRDHPECEQKALFTVRKLPKEIDIENELELLLALFRAKTEEELKRLEALEVPIVTKAIGAYREITVSPEFREIERLRADARHNEASALQHAAEVERKKWQSAIAVKDAELAGKDAEIERLRAMLNDKR
jgi:hypothetical protein